MISIERKRSRGWRYVAAFLTKEATESLKDEMREHIPEGWDVFCHHATIVYNNRTILARLKRLLAFRFFGRTGCLLADAIGISDKAVAVRLSDKSDGRKGHRFQSQRRTGHVTVAVAPGAKPADSNAITEWYPLVDPIVLPAIIGEWTE